MREGRSAHVELPGDADTQGMNAARRHQRSDRGASLAEYALLLGLVSVVALGAITFLGGTAAASFERAASQVSSGADSDNGAVGDSTGGAKTSTRHIVKLATPPMAKKMSARRGSPL